MDFGQLKNLCLVVQCGTVREAAERTFLSPAAVSLQIKELEQELGIKIFERVGRKLVLTSAGDFFYCEAQKVIKLLQNAIEKTRLQALNYSGEVNVAAAICLRYFYLPIIARFRAAYPSIRLNILDRNHIEARAMIRSGEADFAMGLFLHPFRDLEEISLVNPGLILIVPKKHPFASKKRIALADLADHSLTLLRPTMVTRKIIDATFQRQSLNPKLEMEASSCFEVKRYVAHGRGIGIIHQICLEPGDIDQFRFLSLTRQIPHPTAKLIFRRSKTFTAVEKKLVEMLLAMRPSTRKRRDS
jgi:DNA-binding transcriptional LysR family regulator